MKSILDKSIKELEAYFCKYVKELYAKGEKVSAPKIREYVENEIRESGKLWHIWTRCGCADIGLHTEDYRISLRIYGSIRTGKTGRNVKFDNSYLQINTPCYTVVKKENGKFKIKYDGYKRGIEEHFNVEMLNTPIKDIVKQVNIEGTKLNRLYIKSVKNAKAMAVYSGIVVSSGKNELLKLLPENLALKIQEDLYNEEVVNYILDNMVTEIRG